MVGTHRARTKGGVNMEVNESAIHRQVGGIKAEAFHHPVADRRIQPHRQRKLAVAAFLRAMVRDLAPGHEAASLADARRA